MSETNKSRYPLWVRIVLIASLGLNLAVAGVAIGSKFKDRRGDPDVGREISWIIRLAPDDKRKVAREHMARIRDELRESASEREQHLEGIVTAIRTDTFAEEALSAILAERRASAMRRQELVHGQLISLMAGFTTDERAVFADNLEEQLERLRARLDETR